MGDLVIYEEDAKWYRKAVGIVVKIRNDAIYVFWSDSRKVWNESNSQIEVISHKQKNDLTT